MLTPTDLTSLGFSTVFDHPPISNIPSSPLMKSRSFRLLMLTLYIFAISGSLVFANLKRTALAYDEVDYAFYAQFAAKLLDPQLTNRYSAQPDGYNFFGLTGVDGQYSLNQSIHFELIKYVYAILYRLIPSPIFLAFFIAAVYFSPVLYLAFIHPAQNMTDCFFILGFTLLYIGFPSVVHLINFDLRPRILQIPVLVLAIFSIHYRRPFLEKLLYFGSFFLLREEALLFSPTLIVYNYLRSSSGKKNILSLTSYILVWLIFGVLIFQYFKWTAYQTGQFATPLHQVSTTSLLPVILIGGVICLLILLLIACIQEYKPIYLPELLQTLGYATIFLPLSAQLFTEANRWSFPENAAYASNLDYLLFSPKMTVYFVAILLFFVIVRASLKTPKQLTVFNYLFLSVGILLLGINLSNLPNILANFKQRATAAQIVFQTQADFDPYHTRILTDYNTYQAFFNYENVYLYQRLPWSIAGEERYFPDNRQYLRQILRDEIDYIIINASSKQDILALLIMTNLQPASVIETPEYQIFRLE